MSFEYIDISKEEYQNRLIKIRNEITPEFLNIIIECMMLIGSSSDPYELQAFLEDIDRTILGIAGDSKSKNLKIYNVLGIKKPDFDV